MSSRKPTYLSQGLVVALITLCAIAVLAYVNRPSRPQPQSNAPTTAPAVAQTPTAAPTKPEENILKTETPSMLAGAKNEQPVANKIATPAIATNQPAAAPTTQPLAKKSWDELVPNETPKEAKFIPLANVSASEDDIQKQVQGGDLLSARASLNAKLLSGTLSAQQYAETKLKLAELNRTIILSTKRFADDPYGGTYAVQNGDSLQKIAKSHNVTWELLGRLNDISDPRKLRAGRAIKIINGPFHAVVSKSKFEMDIWLGEPNSAESMYVTTLKVGLGKAGSTPMGTWIVTQGGKQKNPKFWGAGDLPPMEADDPKNPLGEFWLALTGIAGEAEGRESYGIHGTIEPNSIGKEASLGCIRLATDDIALVYELLVDGKSKVYVRD